MCGPDVHAVGWGEGQPQTSVNDSGSRSGRTEGCLGGSGSRRMVRAQMIGDKERLLSTSRSTIGEQRDRQDGRWKGIRSACGTLGVLTNQHKYTGQEHRVAGTKKKGGNQKTSKVRLEKNTKKKVQTKDAEEVIKAYDRIVEK